MKIAVVFDDLIQFGGAERLLLAVLEIWPNAPLYTSVASKEWLGRLSKKGIAVNTSFMQKLPFKNKFNRFYGVLGLHALAMESFDFSSFEIVLSISARYAHGVITGPDTKHICYMNSPGRMFWEPRSYFEREQFFTKLIEPFLSLQRLWDYSAAHRVDYFIANSFIPQSRIKKYYGLDAKIIHPFCDIPGVSQGQGRSSYYLVISRLLPWKNIDIAIKACGELNLPLKIIGDGPQLKALKSISRAYENIEFLGFVSEEQKCRVLSDCTALIQTQFEDFGIVPLEAMACGKPVIAFGGGGVLETVIPGITGEFFNSQTMDSLIKVLDTFKPELYKSERCIAQAQKFSKKEFQRKIENYVDNVYLNGL